jgi:seryl-tRNA synthetase
LLRQHQFQKIELVKVCSPETADVEYAGMVRNVEKLLISLELPFRKVLLNSSDMGFSSSICHDFEVWLPGQQKYREISSVSHCSDFQSRRMGMRYRVVDPTAEKSSNPKKVTVFPHTMNGSGLAVGRALVAILENFQRSDGSVDIPPVLHSYMNGVTLLVPPDADHKE